MPTVLSLPEASQRSDTDFIARLLWRASPILCRIRQAVDEGTCGELRSIRFTWARPKQRASDPARFLYDTLGSMLDGVCFASGADCKRVHIEKADGKNLLFALATFSKGIVAEFELNECLPQTLPDTCFVKANFTHGHITNQPLVGHFNGEGAVLADDSSLLLPIQTTPDMPLTNGPIEYLEQCFELALRANTIAPGPHDTFHLITLIQEAIAHAKA